MWKPLKNGNVKSNVTEALLFIAFHYFFNSVYCRYADGKFPQLKYVEQIQM